MLRTYNQTNLPHLRQVLAGEIPENGREDAEFLIKDKESGEFLGTAGLYDLESRTRSAEYAITIWDKRHHGQGYGTDATIMVLWVAFYELGLSEVFLNVYNINKKARMAYERAGFRMTSAESLTATTEEKFPTYLVMEITAEEFRHLNPPTSYPFVSKTPPANVSE